MSMVAQFRNASGADLGATVGARALTTIIATIITTTRTRGGGG